MEIQLNFQWNKGYHFNVIQMGSHFNPVEISMKYQWKYIGNPGTISIEIPMEISMKYHWKYQFKSIGNPVEISMKYQ